MGSSPFGNRGVPSVGSSFGEQTSYSWRVVPFRNRCTINMTGSSPREQRSYSWRQFLPGTDELLLEGSSFREQIGYNYDGQFLSGTYELLMTGSSLRERRSYESVGQLLMKGSSFREQINYTYDGQFVSWTDVSHRKGSSLWELTSYSWRVVLFRNRWVTHGG